MKTYYSKLPKVWFSPDNKKISCKEKIKKLQQNIEEFEELSNDILDEAILMGVDEGQFLEVLRKVVLSTKSNLKSAK